MEKVNQDASLDFKWLVKRGIGGKKKEIRFYASFMYDEVEYVLNDCVYMYKEGLREPYIGKLTKIWDDAVKGKKVKIHWFFRPEEISKWLGDTKTLENEILFASGEGVGLFNISPLEAIAGKCNVVCISKDPRNPQPSDEELKAADFVFYRTFDVGSCTISDNMGHEKIGGIEIKDIFNTRRENGSTHPDTTCDIKEENQTTKPKPQQLLIKTLPNNLKDVKQESQDKVAPVLAAEEKTNSKMDEKEVTTVPANKTEANKRKNIPAGSDNLHGQPLKKTKLDDKNPPKEKQVEIEADRDSVKKDMVSKKSINASVTAGKNSEMGKTDASSVVKADKDNSKISKDKNETKVIEKEKNKTDKLDDRPLKKRKSPPPPNAIQAEVEVEVEKMTDLPSKKSKDDGKLKDEGKLGRSVSNLKGVGTSSGPQEERANLKNDKGKMSDEMEGKMLKKTKVEGSFKIPDNNKKNNTVINANGSNGKKPVVTEEKSKIKSPKDMYQEFVVGPKPNADKCLWLKPLPWDESLKYANEHGTAILVHNLDPDYTSQDVQNIIWHALKENCEAKILPLSAISSPHSYQALVLLKTKEAAQRVLAKLDDDCLMLSNGRPLVGTPCPPIIPRSHCKFFGHLAVDRMKINQREEEAVSTSHFSQPNTIEYDMAMEWFLLQSKSKKWWKKINEVQGTELKNLEAKLVKK